MIISEPNKGALEKKFQMVLTLWTDFGLSVNLSMCVVFRISFKVGSMEKITFNNHIRKKWSIKYLK